MIHLYFWPTPNGHKVSILLEELGVEYRIVPVDIGRGEQFTDDFLRISPNNRMPAMVDDAPFDSGEPLHLFESCAILMYLADKYGQFLPTGARERAAVMQWVFWQAANQGPKLGESHHFRRLGNDQGDQSYAVRRFTDEANRLYGVMNNQLYRNRFLAGEDYTIADMAAYPWTRYRKVQGQDFDEFPYVERWYREMKARDAVLRGIEAGRYLTENQPEMTDEEKAHYRKILYNQRARPVNVVS